MGCRPAESTRHHGDMGAWVPQREGGCSVTSRYDKRVFCAYPIVRFNKSFNRVKNRVSSFSRTSDTAVFPSNSDPAPFRSHLTVASKKSLSPRKHTMLERNVALHAKTKIRLKQGTGPAASFTASCFKCNAKRMQAVAYVERQLL